jgi:hypothetical protein
MRSLLIITTVLIFCFAGVLFFSFSQRQATEYAQFDENNNLIRPKGYRSWVFAGTAATPKSHDSTVFFPDFQNVYIDPEGYKYWKEHGEWKEGTIFVKELLRAGDTISAVGRGFYQGDHYSVSAMVKDSKRFPDMHDGWNYFRFVDAQKHILVEKSAPLGAKCGSCHLPNAIDGNIFYQYYPNILQAKGFGTGDPEDLNTRKGLDPGYKYVRMTSEYLKTQTRSKKKG